MRPSYNNRFVRQYLIRALSDPWCRTGQLVPASLVLIKSNRDAGQCIERAVASWPTALSKEDLFGTEALLHWPPTICSAPYSRTRRQPGWILSTSWRWLGEPSFLMSWRRNRLTKPIH